VSDSEQNRLLLIVEGDNNVRRLKRLLSDLLTPPMILIGHGTVGVQRTCGTLGSGFSQPYLGVCDRDLMSDDEVADLHRRVSGLFFWPLRCLENELLYPPLLCRALDMSGYVGNSETRVRAVLREIADTQYQEVHAKIVGQVLHREYKVLAQHDEGDSPLRRIINEHEARRNSAQRRLSAMSTVASRVERELRQRWDADHLVLLNGKAALHQVAQRLATNFKGRGFEDALLRHALDDPPPGIAALRAEMDRLLR
jgi:hypothetical protein